MKRITTSEKVRAELEILLYLNHNDIQANITKSGRGGFSEYYNKGSQKRIKIPSIRNHDNIGVSFHEIAHIVLGHCEMIGGKLTRKKLGYHIEYEAEQWAIAKMQELKIDHKLYELSAIRYQLENIAQAYNRKHPLSKVPKEIIEWTGLKVRKWNKAKKVFVHRARVTSRKDVEKLIQYIN